MKCARCGIETPRLTVKQTRCPRCEAEVAALIANDAKRHQPRFTAKILTGSAL